MKLTLKRIALRPTYTIGQLSIDGEYFCDTLEDTVRDLNKNGVFAVAGGKVYGSTAIPYGTYRVTLGVKSPRFSQKAAYAFCGGYLPRLLDVPQFEGVLIHIGNTPKDTDGCILVGRNTIVGQVTDSTATFRALYPRLKAAADRGEKIYIEVV